MFSANTSQVSNDVKYIEDFFSAWLRTGTGSSQTVTTGIKENTGALVISKSRSAATDWAWYDTFRGSTKDLVSNSTAAETTQSQGLTSFNADGHTWGTLAKVNTNGATYVDYVLKPTPKFFDVVTYTGNGTGNRQIAHNLGSVPGCIIIKAYSGGDSGTDPWIVYHRSTGNTQALYLNQTDAAVTSANWWNNTSPTDTNFTVNTSSYLNQSGETYVAYLFAHDAGGFGLTGTDNVISCGSFTADASGNAAVNLGYEPQWVLVKNTATGAWWIQDVMRPFSLSGTSFLEAQSSAAETAAFVANQFFPTATGFQYVGAAPFSATLIYIAIRRGPMRTPTSGTSVFAPIARTGTGASAIITTGFPVDSVITADRPATWSSKKAFIDRLRGSSQYLVTSFDATSAERSDSLAVTSFASNTGISVGADTNQGWINYGTGSYITYLFRRAPGFFDEVCYTGDGTVNDVAHNLGVVPELIIGKRRNSTGYWAVYSTVFNGGVNPHQYALYLNSNAALTAAGSWFLFDQPTASRFRPTTVFDSSGGTYVAYLFASCPGVSKVGSYTGNGSSQTINCGFTGGARFVLIKRTDSTGDWYVWDTARGIVSANDPRLSLNSTAAEVTTDDSIDPDSSGFIVNQVAATNINVSSATYIYLAIA